MTDGLHSVIFPISEARPSLPQWFVDWLNERRILEAALTMQWGPYNRGAKYPVFNPLTGAVETHRWKSAPGQSKYKYLWIPAGQKATYYAAPGLPDAIAGAAGLLWIANGEPSVLAFHAAGIKNVLSWFGEGSIPQSVVKDFLAMGVTQVIYLPDNDYAGYQAAIKFRDMLQASGIDYEFRTWGRSQVDRIHVDKQSGKQTPYIACDDVLAKADANDIWKLVQGDSVRFAECLQNAPFLQLPAPQPKRQQTFDDSDFEETPEGLIDAIASALGVQRWKDSGWSNHVTSPFRDDRHPSFSLNKDSGVGLDWGDNKRSYSPSQIAERFGIDWRRYYPVREWGQGSQVSHDYGKDENCAHPGQVWFTNGLPDSWRTALLNYMGKTAAAIVELANEAARTGALDASCFCIDDLITAMSSTQFHLSPKTIRNQFAELKPIFFLESDTITINNKRNTLSDFGNNPCGGRPTTCYSFQSLTVAHDLLLQRVYKRLTEKFLPADPKDSILPVFTGEMLQAEGMDISSEQATLTANVLNKHEAVSKVHTREEQKRQTAQKRIDRQFRKLTASLSNVSSTPLMDEPVKNGAVYRDLYYKSTITSEGVAHRSRKQIAEKVGIQPQQVTALHKRIKVESIERKPEIEVKAVSEIEQIANENRAKPVYVVVTDTRTGERISTPNSKGHDIHRIANEALRNGNRVRVCLQMANEQRLMTAAKRLYVAWGKYLIAQWLSLNVSLPDERPAAPEKKEPEQLTLFPDETKEPEPTASVPRKPVKPGPYYRAGYDPAWVVGHLNRVLLIAKSPYKLTVLTTMGQDESLKYHVRLVTLAGVDIGKLTDKLLLQALHTDPLVAEAVMLGAVAQ